MARTPKAGRLLSIVAVLRQSDRPLHRRELFAAVPAYRDYDGKRESLLRTFERDKAELKDMGLGLETVQGDEGDELNYRLPAAKDPALRCDQRERLLLAAAAQALGSLPGMPGRELASTALAKLLEAPVSETDTSPEDPNLARLLEWLSSPCSLRFLYRTAGRKKDRFVALDDPALTCRQGRWYLLGYDQNRRADRTFRLDRIKGAIERCAVGSGKRERQRLDLWHLAGEELLDVTLKANSPRPIPLPEALLPSPCGEGIVNLRCSNRRALLVWLCGQDSWQVQKPESLAEEVKRGLEVSL
ncbi:MAG: hypothetical protein CMH50_06375 [Myxococcales bacterium]|nr:hypothetical protein [Myxococcales bacterium]